MFYLFLIIGFVLQASAAMMMAGFGAVIAKNELRNPGFAIVMTAILFLAGFILKALAGCM